MQMGFENVNIKFPMQKMPSFGSLQTNAWEMLGRVVPDIGMAQTYCLPMD